MKAFFRSKIGLVAAAYDRVAQHIDHRIRRWAQHLNQRCASFSTRQLTIGLIVFCLVFGSAVGFTIWQSLNSFARNTQRATISAPRHILLKDSLGLDHGKSVSILKERIKHWLDSVKATPDGGWHLQQLREMRPGLLDSLKALDHIE